MNPFSAYRGIRLNGRFINSEDLHSVEPTDSFEKEVLDYCIHLFDDGNDTVVTTSGSTGAPKELVFPKSALIKSAEETNDYFNLHSQSKALLCLPLQYVAAKLMVVRAVVGEFELITKMPAINPLKDLTKTISFVPMTPHQAATALLDSPKAFDLVEILLLGGGKVSRELRGKLSELAVKSFIGFGMAETLTHFALNKISRDTGSHFHKLSDVKITTDERGCLVVNRPGITEGNLLTNDLVELTDEGFKWLGRIDNLINSGGVKIIPEEVEQSLHSIIDSNFFIAGIPDSMLGMKVVLFIEGSEKPDLEKVDFQEKYHRPKEIINMKTFLYTRSGKIRRKETVQQRLGFTDC